MRASTIPAAVVTAVCVVALSGCALLVEKRSLGIAADEVAVVEYYEYRWGDAPETIERLTIDDPEVVAEWVRAYTDMPVSDVDPAELGTPTGEQIQSTRFTLEDGRRVEISGILLGPKNVVVLWPDGTAKRTVWGSPGLLEAYEGVGVVDEVDAAERPDVALPG